MNEGLRLMAVHAHPDDESSKGAATMARYAAEGVSVLVVTCTGGERGEILNPLFDATAVKENIRAVREREMARAREILGVEQIWLGFVDSGFPNGQLPPSLPEGCFAAQPLDVAAEPLVRAVREFRPHVILTYSENGDYPHPDHAMCHEVSVEAFEAAGDPDRYPGAGDPWQPLKLYYHLTFHRERSQAEHAAMLRHGLERPPATVPEEIAKHLPTCPITTKVACAEYFEVRDRALLAHASQIDPNGPFFGCPRHIQREAWPTEDYYLARSLVDTELPEDDIFRGCDRPQSPLETRTLVSRARGSWH
jgi:mycothiol S-conjugate amidase